jgi:hypothetical protein
LRQTESHDRCLEEEPERLVLVRLNRLEGILGFEIVGEAVGARRSVEQLSATTAYT